MKLHLEVQQVLPGEQSGKLEFSAGSIRLVVISFNYTLYIVLLLSIAIGDN